MKYIIVAWLAGCGADATSTSFALNNGAREVVLTQSNLANGAIITGEASIGAYSLNKLYKTHPKLAMVIGIVASSARFGVAYHNIGVIRSNR